MSNESKQPEQNAAPETGGQPKAAPKSGLIKYLIFGVAGLVLIAGVAYGTLLLMGGGAKTSTTESEETSAEVKADSKSDAVHGADTKVAAADTLPAEESLAVLNDDSLLAEIMKEAEADSSILDDVQAQLAYLDAADSQNPDSQANPNLSKADSAKESNWIAEQKALLAKRENELVERERKLEVENKKIQQKITRIEQAESARVTNLAKLYDGMEARQVAELMANLDDETVVSVLPRMKAKNASQVLGLMPPARAAKLSKQMITIAGTE